MASSVDLSECVAEALGVPAVTTLVHMRNLRGAGILTKSGRGRSAAKMTARDAAHLLIAVAGSNFVRESVETVQAYAGLLAEGTKSAGWPIASLPRQHTFGDALTALIHGVSSGELHHVDEFAFYVEMRGPRPEAWIDGAVHTENERRYIPATSTQSHAEFLGDLETRRRFSHVTIRMLGELIRS